MTSILKNIHEAIEASRNSVGFSVNEDPGNIWIVGKFSHAALLAWQAILDEQLSWLSLECTDESLDRIAPRDGIDGEMYKLHLSFVSPPTTPHLFTPEGWRVFLYSDASPTARVVKLAFIESGFETRAFKVEVWDKAPVNVIFPEQTRLIDNFPRRQVRSYAPEIMAPLAIEPWIIAGQMPEHGLAFDIWKEVAALMIAKSLPNELFKDGNLLKVVISGQPARRLEFGAFAPDNVPFLDLQLVASWIYLEGEDVEVRHTFLSGELAREWSPEVSFCEGLSSRLSSALDSARLIYKAHLRTRSKDTLKALADLRKTLADEVQKLLQQSKDLSSAVWRDVAIAIGVLVIRFATDSAKVSGASSSFAAIYFALASYIAISYIITVATNNNFLSIVENSRKSWRNKLYAFLDDDDYQTLAESPLKEAVTAYKRTQKRTTCVVISVIFALIFAVALEVHWIAWQQLIELVKNCASTTWVWLSCLLGI